MRAEAVENDAATPKSKNNLAQAAVGATPYDETALAAILTERETR